MLTDHVIHHIVTLADSHMACGVQNATYGSLQRADVTCAACLKPPSISEKVFQAAVIRLAKAHAWAVYHTFDSRKSAPGFPDLVLCKPPRLIVAELKTDGAKSTLEQTHWLGLLRQVPGIDTYLWRPANMAAITAILETPCSINPRWRPIF